MVKIKSLKNEELIDLVETLAYRIALAESKEFEIVDDATIARVLEEEGVELC